MTAVSVRPHILKAGARRHEMADGLSLAEIAANVPDLPLGFFDGLGCIRINGHIIPEANWPRVRPKGGTPDRPVVVELYVMPAKGSQLLQIFASVALIGATWAATSFLGPFAGAVVGIAGQLLLNALFPPSKPKPPKDPINGGFSGNPYQPLEILPTVAGRLRAPPPPLAPAYTYLDDEDIYVVAVVGYCGDLQVQDVWVNGTDVNENEGIVEYFTQEATGGPIAFNGGTEPLQTVIEDRAGLQLTAHHVQSDHTDTIYDQSNPVASLPKWHSFRMRGPGDEARFRLVWPSGLANVGAASPSVQAMPVRVQFRRVGAADFTNGPEFWFQEDNQKAEQVRQEIRFVWVTPPVQDHSELWSNSQNFAWGALYWAAAFQGSGHSGNREYQADAYFKSPGNGIADRFVANHVTRDENGFTVYLDPSVFPQGEYEFRIKRGLACDRGEFNPDTYNYQGSISNGIFFDYIMSGGTAKVRSDQSRKVSTVSVESFSTWDYTYPLPAQTDVPLSLVAIKAKNVQIGSISALFTSRAYLWNGADWSTYGTTQNPAALYRFLRTSNMITDPLDPSVLDDTALENWYTFCAANGLACGAIVADGLDRVLATICTAGWAFTRESETAGVVWEYDRSAQAPVQVFTPLNSANFQTQKPFDLLPHAIYAEFQNEDKDYQKDTRVIYGDIYDATTATRFETITYDSITNADLIDLRAQLDWRQLYYRQCQITIDIGAENLMSQRGDLVALAHDVITGPYAYGIVDSVMINVAGTNVLGLRLQSPMDLSQFGGAALGVAIRYTDGTIVEKAIIETTDSQTVTFSPSFAVPAAGLLTEDCLVTVGVIAQKYQRMLIFDIKRAPDWKATLVLVDEAQQIHAGAVSPGGPLTLDFSIKQNSQYLGVI